MREAGKTDTVTVSREWFEWALFKLNGRGGCPFCGSSRPPIVKPADETFLQRRGCGDCDTWLDPVQTRK